MIAAERLTRADVERIVTEARADGETPDLRHVNLRGADLRFTDLRNADLRRTNLRYTDLYDADLRRADLRRANLRYTDLRHVNLRGADLRDTNMYGADLRHVNLRGVDLRGADLRYTDMHGANWMGLHQELPSGSAYLIPSPSGWTTTIGCWRHKTLDDLRALIASDDPEDWPEARGDEIERRRPHLVAWLALCEAQIAYHGGTEAKREHE